MKIQCDVCEKAEAEVLCCADEAVLCDACDAKVHAANKLSLKHQRVLILKTPAACSSSPSSFSQLPLCDHCKERKGYLFCLEDRALLCRDCDISTHAASPYASKHQRFLIAGMTVSLQPSSENTDIGGGSSSSRNLSSRSPMWTDSSFEFPGNKESTPLPAVTMGLKAEDSENAATFPPELHFPAEPHWPLDDFYDKNDFNFYEFSEFGSS